jgi:Recombination endonuclease VII
MDKICTECKEAKPATEFHKDKNKKFGLQNQCKTCRSSYRRIYYLKNKKRILEGSIRWQRSKSEKYKDGVSKRLYGVSKPYAEMLKEQGGVCGICGKEPEPGRRFCVDHSHETNSIRGILCHACNLGLGNFKDNDKLLLAAIKYLKKSEVIHGESAGAEASFARKP